METWRKIVQAEQILVSFPIESSRSYFQEFCFSLCLFHSLWLSVFLSEIRISRFLYANVCEKTFYLNKSSSLSAVCHNGDKTEFIWQTGVFYQ